MPDSVKIDECDCSFNVVKFETINLLLTEEKPSIEYLQELKKLLDDILSIFKFHLSKDCNKNILGIHPGGNQAYQVFECLLQGQKVAVKLYKPIATHLVVHTFAISHLLKIIPEFDQKINDRIFTLNFPKTIAIGNPFSMDFVFPVSILVQEWVNNSKEIYKAFPKEHLAMIKSIVKILTLNKGFMIDIMSKNWLVSNHKNEICYVDLVLFNPTGKIQEQIKNYVANLD